MATSITRSTRSSHDDLPEVHGYDDELARLDAVATVEALDRGDLSVAEVTVAAVRRAQSLDPRIAAVAFERYGTAPSRRDDDRHRGGLDGIPTFIKDMVPVAGLPMTWGSAALEGGAAQRRTGGVAHDIERMGMTILGSSTMPEWGFIPSTEFPDREPTRNPWNVGRTVGGSSGGAAALVAAGVVPIAHAVDGGGSTRIPAACAGLVGLKPTLGRLRRHSDERLLPVSISVDGVVSRSVRDTARWYAEVERVHRPRRDMPPIGEVTGPPSRRLRIGVLGAIPEIAVLDTSTQDTLEATAATLEALGHHVEEMAPPVHPAQFRDDFVDYYRFLVFAATRTARLTHGAHFRSANLTAFTTGMAESFRSVPHRVVGAARRLRRVSALIAAVHESYDLILSPTLATAAPELGYLSPSVDFETLLGRVTGWMTFTPLANAAGTPSISLPMGFDEAAKVPVGSMLSPNHGCDALLLQVAFELERARPWPLSTLAA